MHQSCGICANADRVSTCSSSLRDRYVIDLLARRAFGTDDFFETRTGVCRITPGLASELAATRSHWGALVGQVAEEVAHTLVDPPPYEALARPFTRPSSRRRTRVTATKPDKRTALPNVNRRCANCGKSLADRDARTCSDECLEAVFTRSGHRLAASMQASLKSMRETGENPQARPEAKRRMAAGLARQSGRACGLGGGEPWAAR